MKIFDMDEADSFPDGVEDWWNFEMKEERQRKLHSLSEKVVAAYVDLFTFCHRQDDSNDKDHVHEYAKEIISLGMLYMEFQDAIRSREGDGNVFLIVGSIS